MIPATRKKSYKKPKTLASQRALEGLLLAHEPIEFAGVLIDEEEGKVLVVVGGPRLGLLTAVAHTLLEKCLQSCDLPSGLDMQLVVTRGHTKSTAKREAPTEPL